MTTSIPADEIWPDIRHSRSRSIGCSPLLVVPLAVLLAASGLASLALKRPIAAPSSMEAELPTAAISNVFTPEVQFWASSIQSWANAADMDPDLVAVVMQIESCGDPWAISSAGAVGLFQVMPFHFLGSDDPFAPDTNAKRALDYLSQSLAAAQGDARLALAGYNGGIGLISEPEWSWPAETQRYSYWASGIYTDTKSGASRSPRLAEWLSAAGEALCQRAGERLDLGS